MSIKYFKIFLLAITVQLLSCQTKETKVQNTSSKLEEVSNYQPIPYVKLKHPEWSKNASIYELNVRQFSPEGSFKAVESQLPRIKAMGIDIIWLMPIHPIGKVNRKGIMGSYYSVKDYYGVNPQLGTLKDLKHLIHKIHEMGMFVILDWVANHSSWDNPIVKEHPDWYIKTRQGNFQSTPWRDYDDIIDFDYSKPELRKYMTKAMTYWVKEVNIDGFRCDVASFVPIDFWENARKELDAIKPIFMLAEAADRDLHARAFDMTYAWALWDNLHRITTQKKNLNGLTEGYIAELVSTWPSNAYRMNFIDNHDKNSWEGTQFSNFGDGLYASIVLTCTIDGMPMVYSGQEAGLDRSLNFFEKDPIEWKEDKIGELYKTLLNLKHKNQSLWNGHWGGKMERIKNDKMGQVISFSREKNGDKIITIVNMSNTLIYCTLESQFHTGKYTEVFSNTSYNMESNAVFNLKPWEYKVYESLKNQ